MSAAGRDEASSIERVRGCWNDLILRRAGRVAAAATALDGLIGAYREPHRQYHTLDHIAALLVLLDGHCDAGTDRDALALAILYHDAVYDPRRKDNEAASASLAAKHLTGLGFPEGLVTKVVRCILATQHGQGPPATTDADLALLVDLDLSIFAATRDAYRTYALGVRGEYAHVPDAVYRLGRRRMLEAFLGRRHIYLTRRLRHLWEAPARANIKAEIAELGQ